MSATEIDDAAAAAAAAAAADAARDPLSIFVSLIRIYMYEGRGDIL